MKEVPFEDLGSELEKYVHAATKKAIAEREIELYEEKLDSDTRKRNDELYKHIVPP